MKHKAKPTVHRCGCGICRQHPYSNTAREHRAINRVLATLHEKNRRRFVGLLALQWGWGGTIRLRTLTGLSRGTIQRGRTEVQRTERPSERRRVRERGAGRWAAEKNIRGY